ncbi:hypothetical protein EXIGLDRAFT_737050 [Exidia glandulosa HHB12029]|uniref:Uncharacterized protein n=1 Tax=Exidia glandulosa HHB12029 TaxID=1314781 RepID=A0A166ARB6_EXIGL|nr:hypothetical protein EXIGLDRAFT_737050 [Exidia glandulosa HHB12029]
MSCTLSVAARDDVVILPDLKALDKSQHGQLEALWNRLRITSVDAAQYSAGTVWDFASSNNCLYFACLVKCGDNEPLVTTSRSPFSPVDSSWAAPTSLGIDPSYSGKSSVAGVRGTCAAALDELRRRTFSFRLPSETKGEPGNVLVDLGLLGDLVKAGTATVFSDGRDSLCGIYLFQNALLFVFQDTAGALFVHRIALSRVVASSQQSQGSRAVDVVVGDERNARQVVYSFVVDSDDQVKAWGDAIDITIAAVHKRDVALDATLQALADASDDSVTRAEPASTSALQAIVFLAPSASGEQEVNIGVCVARESEGHGLGTYLISHALSLAFDTLAIHRVQARVMHPIRLSDASLGIRAKDAFIRWGFTDECRRRRGLMHPLEKVWTDETILGVLDSDWVVRDSIRPAPQTLWDEMFTRHQRERESLLQWEGGTATLKRTKSMETVRDFKAVDDSNTALPSTSAVEAAPFPKEEPMLDDDDGANSLPPSSVVDSASSWDAVSQTSIDSVTKRVEKWSALQEVAAADDAADEDASWDDFQGDDDDDAMEEDDAEK